MSNQLGSRVSRRATKKSAIRVNAQCATRGAVKRGQAGSLKGTVVKGTRTVVVKSR